MAAFKKVLLVDDDDLFLHLCTFIMEDENFAQEIIQYDYPLNALTYLQGLKNNDLPEILLLDINMPLMDGWEFLEALSKRGITNDIIIYITSSSINPSAYKRAENHPMVKGFISKPIDTEKLKKIENEFVN